MVAITKHYPQYYNFGLVTKRRQVAQITIGLMVGLPVKPNCHWCRYSCISNRRATGTLPLTHGNKKPPCCRLKHPAAGFGQLGNQLALIDKQQQQTGEQNPSSKKGIASTSRLRKRVKALFNC